MKTKAYRSAPTKMSSLSESDKKGNLLIKSSKEYANKKDNHVDRVLIPKKELDVAKRLKQNDIKGFKVNFYKYCYVLKVTSKFVGTNECKHPRELSHCLRHITRFIGRLDLCKQSGDYGKAGKAKLGNKGQTSKLVKARIKAAKEKRTARKTATTKKR